MSAVLALTTLTGAWRELQCPGTVQLNIDVYDGVIQYQRGTGGRGAAVSYDSEPADLGPANHRFERRCDAVRVRAKNPSLPKLPVVSIEALTATDMSGG